MVMDEAIKCYRIVEIVNGEYHTLFHGIKGDKKRGSRRLPQCVWLVADKKTVKDGSCSTFYESGFHVLKSKKQCEEFLQKMFRAEKNRVVIPILAKNLRPKSHSRHEVYLADEIFIIPIKDQ
jgi:hypothetical protein